MVGANVTLTNPGTGASVSKPTDSDGSFVFDFWRVGTYRLRIEAPGFKRVETRDIDLPAGTNLRRTFALEIGAVNETVSVQGSAPLVNAVSSEQSNQVSRDEAEQLPLSKRNISNLLGLGTGASAGGGFVRLNGVGRTGSLYTVDGTSATADPESRTTSMRGNFEQINLVSLEAVQELQTTKGILPAEYGQVLGGNVNIVTKSGTNAWHGSTFENFQSENLNARLQFLANKPNSVFNQFGGAFSGPIKKDRIFVFGDYEGYRQSVTTVISGNVPTPQFRQTLLTAVPGYAKALSVVPDPNQSFAPGADTALFIAGAPQVSTDNHYDFKGDIRITDSSNLALTYAHGRPFQRCRAFSWTMPTTVNSTVSILRDGQLYTGAADIGNAFQVQPERYGPHRPTFCRNRGNSASGQAAGDFVLGFSPHSRTCARGMNFQALRNVCLFRWQ